MFNICICIILIAEYSAIKIIGMLKRECFYICTVLVNAIAMTKNKRNGFIYVQFYAHSIVHINIKEILKDKLII